MIIACPKCGARNRIPDVPAPGRTFRCGKCGTSLAHALKEADSHKAETVDKRAGGPGRTDRRRLESPLSNRSSLDSLRIWVKKAEYPIVFVLALLVLLTHLFAIPYATKPIYDEVYYVQEAQLIAHEGDMAMLEHPPLAKLFMASGIRVFGDNPWGWRVPSAIFASVSVILFYFICRRLVGNVAAVFAVFLLAFEVLVFNYSGLAMLPVFTVTFMLLSFLLYLQGRYVCAGVSLALSGLCNMTGLLGGVVILAHWLITKKGESRQNWGPFLVSAIGAFALLMPLLDFAASGEWLNPISKFRYMMDWYGSITFANLAPGLAAMQSPPWEWVLDPRGYSWDDPKFYSLVSPTVWILVVPSMGYMVYEFVKKKTDFSLFVLLWFAATFLLWVLLVLVTGRVTYHYYFYPSLGAVCAAVGLGLSRFYQASSERHSTKIKRLLIRLSIVDYLLLHLFFFMAFSSVRFAL